MKRRVVITGMGAVTPIGNDVATFWSGLKQGQSGIGSLTRFNTDGYSCLVAAQIDDFDPSSVIDKREVRRLDRSCQFAIVAAAEAMKNAGISKEMVENGEIDANRFGVIVSSGIGGMGTMEAEHIKMLERGPDRVSPLCVPMMIVNMLAGNVSIFAGAKGPCGTVVTACATGTNSIGDAFKIIQRGDADVMLAGGAEACLTPLAFAGFCSMKAMTGRNDEPSRACRPFDKDRDGFVMGEGAGLLVLESLEHAQMRGANILGEVVGYGWTADAFHITAPSPGGEGGARAMTMALKDAGIEPEAIDYINAHGTSTPINDANETAGIKISFGDHAYKLAISSTKSMIGHLLGASGAVEAIASVMAMVDGFVPPTINYETPDPDCDLDYVPNVGRETKVNYALSNSLGFGGHNACLIFAKWSDA